MSSPSASPVRVAVTGLGGYARHHHLTLQRLEREGLCRVVATCDPDLEKMLPQSADLELQRRGVQIFPNFPAMLDGLAGAADCVTIPTPINHHAPMHRACVERGLPVYLEKPPTLWWEELETMITTDAQAKKPTEVGFNFITEPTRQKLHARLLAGEFGRLAAAGFVGLWPRAEAYFSRNSWAGKLFLAGSEVPLLDSCAGNAMGHYLQNLLHWAAPMTDVAATVFDVRSSLYRVNDIESTDTVFTEARTLDGMVLRMAATHACTPEEEGHAEYLLCENALIRYVTDQQCDIVWLDGRRETLGLKAEGDWQERNFRRYFDYLAGRHAAPVVSLLQSRAFVAWNDLMFAGTPGITPIASEHIERHKNGTLRAVRGIAPLLEKFACEGRWPHEEGAAWAREPARAHLGELPFALMKIRALAKR